MSRLGRAESQDTARDGAAGQPCLEVLFQYGDLSVRMQAPPRNNQHAAPALVPALCQESRYLYSRFNQRLAVKIETSFDGIGAASQFSEQIPIDPLGDSGDRFIGRGSRFRGCFVEGLHRRAIWIVERSGRRPCSDNIVAFQTLDWSDGPLKQFPLPRCYIVVVCVVPPHQHKFSPNAEEQSMPLYSEFLGRAEFRYNPRREKS